MTADFVAIPDEAALASWPEDACSTLRRGRTARYGLSLRSHAPSPMVSRPSPRASLRLVLARYRSATPSCATYARESRDRRPRCVPPASAVRAQLLRTTRPLRHHRRLSRVTDTRRSVLVIHLRLTRTRRAYHPSDQELCGALQIATSPFDRLNWRAALCGATFSPTRVLAVVAQLPPRKPQAYRTAGGGPWVCREVHHIRLRVSTNDWGRLKHVRVLELFVFTMRPVLAVLYLLLFLLLFFLSLLP